MRRILTLFFIIIAGFVKGQDVAVSPALLTGKWPSQWITYNGAAQREYGVYHFRKMVSLPAKPESFVVHVTADNRYRLFVNGQAVCSGPARGDLFNWYFETIDIAPYLKAGNNIIAALVWNMGDLAPVSQVSNQTGFVMQGNSTAGAVVNTDASWKAFHDHAYTPTSLNNGERLRAYMVVGPGDRVDGAKYPWGWETASFNDGEWPAALAMVHPDPVGYGTDNRWTLAARNIPLFKESISRFKEVRRSSGAAVDPLFITGRQPLVIKPHQQVKVLLDRSVNTVAYPEILLSGGKGAMVKMTYAEALFDAKGEKGNRNEIAGKEIQGNYDEFIADGGTKRLFRPLWFHGYRYVEIEINTQDEELTVEDVYGMATGYPLQMNAGFSSSDQSLQDIWNVGWRTAQLCAGDLYYDTPYYEQLQYTGDSRIQALISLYTSGDDRLMRKAILDFYHSRTPEGLTQGRYPSNRLQIIPTFSLFWVSMVHDYWMHKRDDAFVKQFLPAIAEVMAWYENRIDSNGMLGPMKWWNFIDWDNFNDWGVAPGAEDGNSAIISLQCAYTLKHAADLFGAFGKAHQSEEYIRLAKDLNAATYKSCFDQGKGLFANTPAKDSFSQHANIWAVLSDAVEGEQASKVMSALLTDQSIGQVTFFYRFYLTQAMKKAGMANLYYSQLKPWRDMLAMGLTTFAEKPEPTRSDCHAWSASPNYDFLSTICGIMPDAPGFKKVRISPAPGELQWIKGNMPHPDGMISLELSLKDGAAIVSLPLGLKGVFVWKGKEVELHGGTQKISLIR